MNGEKHRKNVQKVAKKTLKNVQKVAKKLTKKLFYDNIIIDGGNKNG